MANVFQSAILRTSRHRSSPSLFSLPGLTARPWHGSDLFEFTDVLKANFDTIRNEYDDVARTKSDYDTSGGEHKLHKGEWDWHSYIQKGQKKPRFRDHSPKTGMILDSIPGLMTNIPFAYSFFSTLHPDASIGAHTGPCNLRLRCHFPLYVPKDDSDIGLRVAGQTKRWEEGEPLVFDDRCTYVESRSLSVSFYWRFWHPKCILMNARRLLRCLQRLGEGWMSSLVLIIFIVQILFSKFQINGRLMHPLQRMEPGEIQH